MSAQKLFEILRKRKTTIKEFSILSGISDDTLYNLRRKNCCIKTSTLARICYCLKVQPDRIIEYIPDET
ncbi:MAG: helix-turn-helix domain-containing protein [Candidatus Bruticola sp.]